MCSMINHLKIDFIAFCFSNKLGSYIRVFLEYKYQDNGEGTCSRGMRGQIMPTNSSQFADKLLNFTNFGDKNISRGCGITTPSCLHGPDY